METSYQCVIYFFRSTLFRVYFILIAFYTTQHYYRELDVGNNEMARRQSRCVEMSVLR